MMDWTRLVNKLMNYSNVPKKLPSDCMLQGFMLASLTYGIAT